MPDQGFTIKRRIRKVWGAEACLLRLKELLKTETAAKGPTDAVKATSGWGAACCYYGNGRTAIKDIGRCRLRYNPCIVHPSS